MKKIYSIWDEMRNMQEQMDSIFENFFGEEPFLGRHPFFNRSKNLLEDQRNKNENSIVSKYKQPISDIYETEKEIITEIELPGLNKKDIQVHIDENGIEIKAENNVELKHEDKKKGMYRFERNYSGFSRYIGLPSNIDINKANAEYKDGILKITIPKLKLEEHKKKLLDIQ